MIMGAARDKDQADFDLERFMELFDEALTSNDPRIKSALGHLMTITAICIDHSTPNVHNGPLRRVFEDQRDILRRIERLESQTMSDRPSEKQIRERIMQEMLIKSQSPVPMPMPNPLGSVDIFKDSSYKGSSIVGYEPR